MSTKKKRISLKEARSARVEGSSGDVTAPSRSPPETFDLNQSALYAYTPPLCIPRMSPTKVNHLNNTPKDMTRTYVPVFLLYINVYFILTQMNL